MGFVDIHTHAARDPGIIQIRDLSQESFEYRSDNAYYSMGIHPWFIQKKSLEQDLQKIEKLIQDTSFIALGECGLDKVCNTNFPNQIEALKRQILLSEKYGKPLILHIVKSYNELVLLRQLMNPRQVWIVHGFNGSPQLAAQLINSGMHISFGFQLQNVLSKASKSIQSVPIESVFLETDNSGFSIEKIYTFASKLLKMNVEQLQSQIKLNFENLFLIN